MLARFENGPRSELYRGIYRWDRVSDKLYLADWLDMREKISGAYEDRARLTGEQRRPATVVCPTLEQAFPDGCAHWPWQSYLNKRQLAARRKKKRELEKLQRPKKPPKPKLSPELKKLLRLKKKLRAKWWLQQR